MELLCNLEITCNENCDSLAMYGYSARVCMVFHVELFCCITTGFNRGIELRSIMHEPFCLRASGICSVPSRRLNMSVTSLSRLDQVLIACIDNDSLSIPPYTYDLCNYVKYVCRHSHCTYPSSSSFSLRNHMNRYRLRCRVGEKTAVHNVQAGYKVQQQSINSAAIGLESRYVPFIVLIM